MIIGFVHDELSVRVMYVIRSRLSIYEAVGLTWLLGSVKLKVKISRLEDADDFLCPIRAPAKKTPSVNVKGACFVTDRPTDRLDGLRSARFRICIAHGHSRRGLDRKVLES